MSLEIKMEHHKEKKDLYFLHYKVNETRPFSVAYISYAKWSTRSNIMSDMVPVGV